MKDNYNKKMDILIRHISKYKRKHIIKETENCKRLHYQIYCMQELQNCCKNLISPEQPYTPAKFRTKVNEIAPPFELPIHGQATADNINHEITLLQERQKTKEVENERFNCFLRLNSGSKKNEIKLRNQNKIKKKMKKEI